MKHSRSVHNPVSGHQLQSAVPALLTFPQINFFGRPQHCKTSRTWFVDRADPFLRFGVSQICCRYRHNIMLHKSAFFGSLLWWCNVHYDVQLLHLVRASTFLRLRNYQYIGTCLKIASKSALWGLSMSESKSHYWGGTSTVDSIADCAVRSERVVDRNAVCLFFSMPLLHLCSVLTISLI